MIIKYKYGVEFEGVLYGWKDKQLYRLPQMIGKRFYALRKCGEWEKGFIIGRKRKSLHQLRAMTIFINYELQEISDKDCPF